MGKEVIGANFKSSGEARVAKTFDQRYPEFFVGHSTQDVAAGTLLPVFSTLDKWYRSGTCVTLHELERELKNARTQLLE